MKIFRLTLFLSQCPLGVSCIHCAKSVGRSAWSIMSGAGGSTTSGGVQQLRKVSIKQGSAPGSPQLSRRGKHIGVVILGVSLIKMFCSCLFQSLSFRLP